MAREPKDICGYELTLNGSMFQSPPPLASQASNFGALPMGPKSTSIAALDAAVEYEIRMGTLDPNMDKKHMRRVISNRYAAKKSHERKANKMAELEKNQKLLEDTIATLGPQLEREIQLRLNLSLENEMLAQQLQITTEINNIKEAEIDDLKREREWLRELLNIQLRQSSN